MVEKTTYIAGGTGGKVVTSWKPVEQPAPSIMGLRGYTQNIRVSEPETRRNPTASDIFAAATGNSPIGMVIKEAEIRGGDKDAWFKTFGSINDADNDDPTFNKWEYFDELGLSDDSIETYDQQVATREDLRVFQEKLRFNSENRKTLEDAGVTGSVASFLGQVFGDPALVAGLAVAPLTGGASGAAAIARSGQILPRAVLNATRVGGAVAAEEFVSQGVRRRYDPSEVQSDDFFDIGAGAVLGGVLGGSVSAWVDYRKLNPKGKLTGDIVKDGDTALTDLAKPQPLDSSLSSAVAGGKYSFDPTGNPIGRALTRGLLPDEFKLSDPFMPPANKAALLSDKVSREQMAKLVGRPQGDVEADVEGVAFGKTVPELKFMYEQKEIAHSFAQKKLLNKYIKDNKLDREAVLNQLDEIGTNTPFEELEQLRGNSVLHEVAYRQKVFMREYDALSKAAKEKYPSFDYNPRNEYYAPVVLSAEKVARDPAGFRRLVDEDISRFVDEAMEAIGDKLNKKDELLKKLQDSIDNVKTGSKSFDDMRIAELTSYYRSVDEAVDALIAKKNSIDELKQNFSTDLFYRVVHGQYDSSPYARLSDEKLPDFFRSRNFDANRYRSYRELNLEKLNKSYQAKVSPQLAYIEVFGTNNKKDIIDSIINPIITRSQGALSESANVSGAKAKKPLVKKSTKMNKEAEAARNLAEAMMEKLEYRYGAKFYQTHPTLARAFALNELGAQAAYLGDVVMGSMTEALAFVMHHNIRKTMPQAVKLIGSWATSKELRKTQIKHLNATGRALSIANNSVITENILETTGRLVDDKLGTGIVNVNKNIYRINGLVYFDQIVRTFGNTIQEYAVFDTLEAVAKGKGKKADIRNLARIGVSQAEASKLYDNISKYKTEVNGILRVDVNKMRSDGLNQLADDWTRVLQNDSNRTYLTGADGQTPLWMSHPIGRPFSLLMKWSNMAHHNYLVPMVQRSDAHTALAASIMVGIGTLQYMLRETVRGNDVSEMNTQSLLYAGISQSGFAGLAQKMGLDLLLHKTRNTTGLEPAYSRYASFVDPIDVLVGAGGSYFNSTMKAAGSAIDLINPLDGGDFDSESEKFGKALRRVAPMQNHPLLRNAYDIVLEGE